MGEVEGEEGVVRGGRGMRGGIKCRSQAAPTLISHLHAGIPPTLMITLRDTSARGFGRLPSVPLGFMGGSRTRMICSQMEGRATAALNQLEGVKPIGAKRGGEGST